MTAQVHSHAVFGFSESLDWTTLHFVEPIDDIKVCSACRAVARKTAFLACRHVLCEPCFENWKSRGSHVCFLDGDRCPENEVHWMEFPREKMMKTKVSCWNRDNGCDIITDVSSIAEHFHRDCAYHSTCCQKCSSTVFRKDIIAHLESQCTDHVLWARPTTPLTKGEWKGLERIREGVRGIEIAFRNTSHKDALQVSSLQGINVNQEENANCLSQMTVEVTHMSEVTKHTLSEIRRSSEGWASQIADLKACRESLCAELDEIKRAAEELGSCVTADQAKLRDDKVSTETLQTLKAEMQTVPKILEELRNGVRFEAVVAQCATADGLSEVLSCGISSICLTNHPLVAFRLEATVRVFENERKFPVKLVWCVYGWSLLERRIQASNPANAVTRIAADGRYNISLYMNAHLSDRRKFSISVRMVRKYGVPFIGSPKKVTLFFINGKNSAALYETDLEEIREPTTWEFRTSCFSFNDLRRSRIILGDVFKVCLTILY